MRRIGATLIAGVLLAIVVAEAFGARSPGAKADVPPGSACLAAATPGPGIVGYKLLVTLVTVTPTPTVTSTPPATPPPPTPTATPCPGGNCPTPTFTATPANANGLCVTVNGTTRSAQIITNAAGCVSPWVAATPNAANSFVSADWGSADCVRPGDSVLIGFSSGSTPPAVTSVTWNLSNGTPVSGISQIQNAVGGVAELPASNGSLPAGAESSGSSAPIYALFAGILLVATAAAGVGWYARRRRLS